MSFKCFTVSQGFLVTANCKTLVMCCEVSLCLPCNFLYLGMANGKSSQVAVMKCMLTDWLWPVRFVISLIGTFSSVRVEILAFITSVN